MDEIQLHNVPAATLVGYKKAEQVVVHLEKVVRVFTFGFDQEYSHYTWPDFYSCVDNGISISLFIHIVWKKNGNMFCSGIQALGQGATV